MKICLLSRFFDLRNGGIGRYSQELKRKLEETEHEVVTVSQDGGLPIGGGMSKYFTYTALESAFKIPEADVYHALTPLESLHAPRPLVTTFHDLIPLLHLDEVKTHYAGNFVERIITREYFSFACKMAIKKSDSLMSVSGQTKREIKDNLGGLDSLREVYHPLDEEIEVVRHGISRDLEPGEKETDKFTVGTLGFLGPRKRHDLLIKSFLKADVNGELLIAGKVSTKNKQYKKLLEIIDGDGRVKFLGFVPDEELKDFYNSLDAFILASKFEGYGLPLVESMACRTPSVTLSDALIPEDVKSNTIVVENLVDWFENPHFNVELEEAYKFAQKHDWKKTRDQVLKVYKEVTK